VLAGEADPVLHGLLHGELTVGDVSEPGAVSTRGPGKGVSISVRGRDPTFRGLLGAVPLSVYHSVALVALRPLRILAGRVLAEVGAAAWEGSRKFGSEVVAGCGEGEGEGGGGGGGKEGRSLVVGGEEIGGDAEKNDEDEGWRFSYVENGLGRRISIGHGCLDCCNREVGNDVHL